MNLSTRLQELRQKSKLSQEDVAEKLGVSRQAVSKWESEQSNPDLDNVIRLSELYDTSTDYILKGIKSTTISDSNKPVLSNGDSDTLKTIIKIVGIAGGIALIAILFIFALSLM